MSFYIFCVCLQVSSGLSGQDAGSGHTSLLGTQVNYAVGSKQCPGLLCTHQDKIQKIPHYETCKFASHSWTFIQRKPLGSCKKTPLNLYWLKCDFLMKLACVLSSTDEPSAQAPNHSQGPPVLHGADQRDSEISSAVQVSAQMMMPRHTNIPLPPVSRKKLSFLLVFVHSLQSVPTNTCTDKSLPL